MTSPSPPMSSSTFPPVPPFDTLHFRPATILEKYLCWTRNHTSWGGLLPLRSYLVRESTNGSQTLTRSGQIQYWVLSSILVPPTPTEEGKDIADTIFAACETLKKTVLVKTHDGEVSEETSYGIASVFTHPACRRQGVAGVLLERLAGWLDTEGDCRISALYSDVGKEFYAKNGGWHPFSARQITVGVGATVGMPAQGVKMLEREDLEELCEKDCEVLKKQFQELEEGKYARVTFMPSFAQACWHFGTEEFVGTTLYSKAPMKKGAMVGDSWIYWVHDFTEKKLVVLRAVELGGKEGRVERLVGLLRAAEEEAREWGFGKIVAWSPSVEMVQAGEVLRGEGRTVVVEEREMDSIPSLRWKGEAKGVVEWDPNEKYAWC